MAISLLSQLVRRLGKVEKEILKQAFLTRATSSFLVRIVANRLNIPKSTVWYNFRKLKRDEFIFAELGEQVKLSKVAKLVAIFLLEVDENVS